VGDQISQPYKITEVLYILIFYVGDGKTKGSELNGRNLICSSVRFVKVLLYRVGLEDVMYVSQ
jgi:hypothetical protein